MEKTPKTVSIVGGGIGGLASAILLAKAGYKVSLYEKNECLGGRASIMYKDGYTFDMGPSRYLMPDIFEEFFESIDEDIHDYLDLKQLSPSYRVFYEEMENSNKKINSNITFDTIENHLNEVAVLYEECFCNDNFGKLYTKDYCLSHFDEWSKERDFVGKCLIFDGQFVGFCRGCGHHKDVHINEIAGSEYMNILLSSYDINKNQVFWFDDACIKKEFRLKGFYNYLIQIRQEWAVLKGYSHIGIYTSKHEHNLISMFRKKGFTLIGEFNNKLSPSEYIILIKPVEQNYSKLSHLDIYADSKRMSDTFESMEPGAGKQFLTFLDRAKIQYEIGMEFCKKNYDSIFDFFRRDIMRKGIKLNIRTTIDHYVARFFKNQLIRKIMQYTTVFLGTAPKQTPALYNIMSHCDFGMGVWYPKGGLHEIAKALHAIGLKHGVEYHLNTEVIGCEIKDNQIKSLIVKKIENDLAHINFYNQETWDGIMSGNKTIETRALNPEEPERYFGGINTGSLIIFINKITGEEIKVKIIKKYIRTNFEQLRNENPSIVCKIYSDHKKYEGIKSVIDFKQGRDFTPGYIEKIEKNGLIGWEFEIVSEYQTIQSDIYLINADMAWFETSVLPKESQTYPKSYRDSKTFAPSGFIIYAGVNKKLPKLDHHNLYFCEDRDKNFGQIFDTKELPEDPSIYVSKITHTDPSMAPEGCENLFILVPIPNGIEISDNQKELYKNMVRNLVEKMAGEDIVGYITTASSRSESALESRGGAEESKDLTQSKGLKSHIVVEEIFTVNDFKSRYNSWKGTALGLAHPIMQTAVFRPNNISKKLDNLFYVGHNTNPGIGVPMVIISAQLALERIKKRFTS